MKKHEDMDNSFLEPEKKHHIVLIILIALITLIISSCIYYFFIDTPRMFYLKLADNFDKNNPKSFLNNIDNNLNMSYDLSFNINSNNEDNKYIYDMLNNVKIAGNTKYTGTIKQLLEQDKIKYKDNDLFDLTYTLNLDDNTVYLKLNNILNKVIKIDFSENLEKGLPTYKANEKDLEQVINSYLKILKTSLNDAEYEKEIVKLNNKYVKKQTLKIDDKFNKNIITKLLQDNEFLESFSKIYSIDTSELRKKLNDKLTHYENKDATLSIYVSLFKNDFVNLEYNEESDSIQISKLKNQYNFEVISSYTLKYKGSIKLDKINNKENINLKLNVIDEKTEFEFAFTYKLNDITIDALDTKTAVSYDELSQNELITVITNLINNEAFTAVLNDLGIDNILTFVPPTDN